MNSKLAKFVLTAVLGLATTLTLNACEEKKKQDGTTTTAETAAATETKPPATASEIPLAKAEEVVKGTFTDTRDKKTYKTVKIGSQVWMAENLNYAAEDLYSCCYGDDDSPDSPNCKKYGRLYDWNVAMKVCPSGWHLPSNKEWDILVNSVGADKVAGKKLKSASDWNDYEGKSGNGTDNYGFSALPGHSCGPDGCYSSLGDKGYWWSFTEKDDRSAYNWIMNYNNDDVNHSDDDKGNAYLSVRCIKD